MKANAILRQNLDDRFAGLLAAQSLAGALGSTGKAGSLAGAVSVVKTCGKSSAQILEGTVVESRVKESNNIDVVVKAVEKSRIAVRADAYGIGRSTVGIGAAFALIYDDNQNLAKIGKNANITAKSLEVRAEKQAVTADDYVFPFDRSDLFTVSKGSADQSGSYNKGLIHLNICDGEKDASGREKNNSLEVNLSTEDVLRIVDTLNYLSAVNYYMESIAGTISTGSMSTEAAVSGAFSMLFAKNATSAEIGEDVTIKLGDGTATVAASSGVNTRVIGGSLVATNAAGVGVNIAGFDDRSKVNASVGKNSSITADGDITVSAEAENDVLAVTVAGVVGTAIDNGAAIGGTMDVILTGNEVSASAGDGVKLTSNEGSVSVLGKNVSDLMLVSTSVGVEAGKGPAAGGTFATAVSENKTYAKIGSGAIVTAARNVTVKAESEENLINVLASASAAVSDQSSAAGVIGVLVSKSDTEAFVGDGSRITAKGGDIDVLALGDVKQVVAMAAFAGSASQHAAGGTVNVGVFEQTVAATVGSFQTTAVDPDEPATVITGVTMDASGNVRVLASGSNQTILATVAGVTGVKGAIAGTIPVVVSQSTIKAEIGDKSTVSATSRATSRSAAAP